jgi:hypothetical protein
MNPYIMQTQGLDQQGLEPIFQNISQQQAAHNAALGEQNQQVAQAGQTQNPSGFNNLAMAMALRGKKPGDGITTQGTGLAYDANGQNPYAYTPQGPDYSQPVGNLFSTRD